MPRQATLHFNQFDTSHKDKTSNAAAPNDALPTGPAHARVAAFCASGGPDVFRSVCHRHEITRPDPFDVDTVHQRARQVFDRVLSQATSPEGTPAGSILLVLGESGGGKTHLLRVFRNQVHAQHLAYCGYLQLTTGLDDYPRYMLSNLIESLEQPYNELESETPALMHLSNALAETSAVLRRERDELRDGEFTNDELANLVQELADNIIEDDRYGSLDLQLIRVMLFLQREEPRLKSRALSWLRCEELSKRDRELLGGVPNRDDPEKMLADIGQMMRQVQGLSLVVCIDQLEEIHNMDDGGKRFRRAMQTVCSLAERVPSSVFVVSCLDDFYTDLSRSLTRATADRIEKADPTPVTLEAHRSLDEIEEIVSRRLQFLLAESDVDFDESAPTFPIRRSDLEQLANQRTRDVLLWCGEFRRKCIEAGTIVGGETGNGETSSENVGQTSEFVRSADRPEGRTESTAASVSASDPVSESARDAAATDLEVRRRTSGDTQQPQPNAVTDVIEFEQLWNDFRAKHDVAVPDEHAQLARLLGWSIRRCSREVTTGHRFSIDHDGWKVAVEIEAGDSSVELLLVGLCNKAAQGGALGRQVKELEDQAGEHKIVVARSTGFPASPKAKIVKQIGELVGRGGRKVVVEDSDWRLMHAFETFDQEHASQAGYEDWLRAERPLSRLKSVRRILDLDNLKPVPIATNESRTDETFADDGAAGAAEVVARDQEPEVESTSKADDTTGCANTMHIGVSTGLKESSVTLEPKDLRTHAAFLGGSGSGKTTLALNIVEQLLVRNVPVILIDRKGDLGGYLTDEFWTQSLSADRAALRDRFRESVDVQLYTPGHPDGNPLSIPMGCATGFARDLGVRKSQDGKTLNLLQGG